MDNMEKKTVSDDLVEEEMNAGSNSDVDGSNDVVFNSTPILETARSSRNVQESPSLSPLWKDKNSDSTRNGANARHGHRQRVPGDPVV